MKLKDEFYRLPLRVDAQRLSDEVRALPASAWDAHPTDFAGNSVARLITVGGGENDEVSGAMAPTPQLLASPYIRQVLASFGVVWSRSRLMRLAPGTGVPEHADINYHWFNRVRVHIPIVTRPEVRFHCGSRAVHMAAGEVWIFDNWRRHRVENPTAEERIHLVADTTGSAAFWRLVGEAQNPRTDVQTIRFEPGRELPLLTERHNAPGVMPPSEVEILLGDLGSELHDPQGGDGVIARFRSMLVTLAQEWRQLWVLHGDTPSVDYARLREATREAAAKIAGSICMRTNQVPVLKVLEARVLRHLVAEPTPNIVSRRAATAPRPRLDRPIIIVAAPRSGSTLLFETLACSAELWTLGGEAHWLVEGRPELAPGAPGIESNRLTAEHCTPELGERLQQDIVRHLRDAQGRRWQSEPAVRLLEKTPKNALRVPFFDRLFPDARFIFLWRDPRENLASIIEAWRSGQWITYPQLPGWDGPWSLLLPPGWGELRGKPLEEIAAYQWATTNELILDDLARLPAERGTMVSYAEFLADPAATVRRLCDFCDIGFGAELAARVAAPLPHARYTLTAPRHDKWEVHRAAIGRVLPSLQPIWDRLRAAQPSPKR
jgi:hypothetical protein